ncbi:sugar phosphate isomerase/epimerase [Flavobacteriaceae bacterium TP-CH-4]|uniref:Sugar phosphate isomerase/epimerase n=1 Tax=Pelagihabitans pacificus TaxID=2696054 RepID=A0A967EBQ1_9FLAO|nr:sugar phosphate isomerase/epimerase [Pelagihabitans pacificus]NHF60526.1 sugar phosphate isomerase/epimerase [Pelagihabitans pacificus]
MKRKDFLKQAGLAGTMGLFGADHLLAQLFTKKTNAPMKTIGIQLFSLPKLLEADFEGGIALLAKMGYTELELFGPYSFSTESAKASWQAITPMLGFSGSGFFGRSADEVKAILNENGMTIPSVHTDLDTLETNIEAFSEARETLGFEYVTIPAIPDDRRTTLDAYKKMADTFNTIGENAQKMGLKFAYHNHGYGLQEVDGQVPFETMIEATDPNLVFLEMDIFWTVAGRANPVDYLKKYAGRYHLMHLKDMKPKAHFAGDGSDASQWMSLFPHMTTAGDGELDLEIIVKTARENGAKHFFVEQDLVKEPEVALKRSLDYLKTL